MLVTKSEADESVYGKTPMKVRNPTYREGELYDHVLKSRFVDQSYEIKVLLPICEFQGSERFPVVYVTDSDELFGGLSDIARMLQGYGETTRFVLVGIGYGSVRKSRALRWRDLVTSNIRYHFSEEIKETMQSAFVDESVGMRQIYESTDAREFLEFIRLELMPFIDENYPTLSGESSYSGYSAGGTFGLFTLFSKPDTFKRYIIGSPGTSYEGHHFCIPLVEEFLSAAGARIDAKLFMSVGELEEFKSGHDQFDLVSGYYLLAKLLRRRAVPGLEMITRVFPGETHATAWVSAFAQGLKTLLGPPDQVPYWPKFSK